MERAQEARREVDHLCDRLQVGQCRVIAGYLMRLAYPANWLSGRPTTDAFLENRLGANWGAWTCEVKPESGDYIVCRHEERRERVREDWDRR